MDIASLLVIAVVIGLIPAAIASSKGENFILWWIFGAALFIVALPMALIMGQAGGEKTCPYCAETIKEKAIVCPHCQRDLPQAEISTRVSTEAYWP